MSFELAASVLFATAFIVPGAVIWHSCAKEKPAGGAAGQDTNH